MPNKHLLKGNTSRETRSREILANITRDSMQLTVVDSVYPRIHLHTLSTQCCSRVPGHLPVQSAASRHAVPVNSKGSIMQKVLKLKI